MRRNKGFTLVEILIVVIILGILAAIVIPQFTQASNDARESALSSDLQTLRSQLELYKVQHLEQYPGVDEDGSFNATLFKNQLLSRTNASGTVGADAASYPFGPYLQKFPTNPFATAAQDGVTSGTSAPAGDGSSGWYFRTDTGKIYANTSGHTTW